MNKKGFMFIETIVMCAILMVGLLIIYNSYTSSIAREKQRLNYDTSVANQYKLYYFKNSLKNNNHNFWLCSEDYNCPIDDIFLNKNVDYIDLMDEEIIGELNINIAFLEIFDIERLYLIKCGSSINLNQEDDLSVYLKTLKICNKYHFVAEFYNKKTGEYSYESMIYPLESD